MTVTFEWYGLFGRGLSVLERTLSKIEFEPKFFIFSTEIKRVTLVRIWPTLLPEIRIPIIRHWRGIEKEV